MPTSARHVLQLQHGDSDVGSLSRKGLQAEMPLSKCSIRVRFGSQENVGPYDPNTRKSQSKMHRMPGDCQKNHETQRPCGGACPAAGHLHAFALPAISRSSLHTRPLFEPLQLCNLHL